MIELLLGDEAARQRQQLISRWSNSRTGWIAMIALIVMGSLLGSHVGGSLQFVGAGWGKRFLWSLLSVFVVILAVALVQRMFVRIVPEPARIVVDYAAWAITFVAVAFMAAYFS